MAPEGNDECPQLNASSAWLGAIGHKRGSAGFQRYQLGPVPPSRVSSVVTLTQSDSVQFAGGSWT
jgi:hypothetical protein